jgi:hypothetical protein
MFIASISIRKNWTNYFVINILKDEGINLETMATTLWFIVNLEPLKFLCVYGVFVLGM